MTSVAQQEAYEGEELAAVATPMSFSTMQKKLDAGKCVLY